MDFEFLSDSVEETIELGCKIGKKLEGGEIFSICGDLGTGKTHLIKGIAEGAGCEDSMQVNSPTFVIVNEYQGRLDIYHIDAYRLDSVGEFEMIGFDDFCYPQSVVLIEWADKVERALGGVESIKVQLSHEGAQSRGIHISNAPDYLGL